MEPPLPMDQGYTDPLAGQPMLHTAREHLRAGTAQGGMLALEALGNMVERSPAALVVRALLRLALREVEAALADARRALALASDHRDAHVVLAQALHILNQHEALGRALRRALATAPADPTLWRQMAGLLLALDDAAPACAAWRRAFALAPQDARVRGGLVAALGQLSAERRFAGDPEGALHAASEAIGLEPESVPAWSSRLFARLMLESTTPDLLHRESGLAGAAVMRAVPPATPTAPPPHRGGPLRVGLLSTSLAQSSVRYFTQALFDRADPARLALTLYDEPAPSSGIPPLELPAHVAAVDVRPLDAAALAERIAADGIEVLVDLMGYGWYGRRLEVLARRPAPHLVTAIGYPGTLGLPIPVNKLTDRLIHPPGGAERLYEAPLYLPHMHCYVPPAYAPPVAPREGSGPIVFGSFNQLSKIGATAVAAWRAALDAVPGSRLLLKRKDLRRSDRNGLTTRLAAQGLPFDRVDVLDVADRHEEHLAAYARIDIGLDSFPYNGTTTTCEALWMGVPVVTLAGDRETARTGLSLLHAAGLPDLAVDGVDAFAAAARRLAEDAGRRADWRRTCRERLRTTLLCDADAYAEAFTAAIEALADKDFSDTGGAWQ